MKSFVPKDGGEGPSSGQGQGTGGRRNAERDFHGEKRTNETHASTTDPDARLFRKGKEAKPCHMGHVTTENRHGLIVDARLTEANGTADRTAALDMITENARPGSTVGSDKITTPPTSSPAVVNTAARRTSLRTPATDAPRSIAAPPVTPAMPSARPSASASRSRPHSKILAATG